MPPTEHATETTPQNLAPAAADPRVYLAAERTLLAWIRTGLAMMGLGFIVAKYGLILRHMTGLAEGSAPPNGLSQGIGVALVALGVASMLLAAVEHVRFARRLKAIPQGGAARFFLSTVIVVLIALAGAAMTLHLLLI